MGKLMAFPAPYAGKGGTVHAYSTEAGFEIAHESASGNSWGHFAQFECAEAAAAGAYAPNRDVLENTCNVDLHPSLLAALPDAPASPRGKF